MHRRNYSVCSGGRLFAAERGGPRLHVREHGGGIRIKTDRKKGGRVENLLYENLKMKNVRGAITFTAYYATIPATDSPKPVTKTTPACKNITVRNLEATSTKDAGVIVGLPEMPIENVHLENVAITSAGKRLEIRHVRGIELRNVSIKPQKGEPLIVSDAELSSDTASARVE